jgi:hypothetical protein
MTRITKTEIRRRLKSAKSAAERLQEDVKWLVSNRAWETLGYANFSEMWEKENGFPAPAFAKIIAVAAMADEGMSTTNVPSYKNGHFKKDIAEAIGYTPNIDGPGSSVTSIFKQLDAGVPLSEITTNPARAAERALAARADRVRSKLRSMGKLPNELINCGWSVYKYQADAVKEIARKANVPDSVVIRSALDLYLNRKQKETG